MGSGEEPDQDPMFGLSVIATNMDKLTLTGGFFVDLQLGVLSFLSNKRISLSP